MGSSRRSSASAPRRTAPLAGGANILIVSDRKVGPERVAMPSLLASRRDPPPSGARGNAAAGRSRRRVGRAAQRAERRGADRLRRRCSQPVSDARHDRTSWSPKAALDLRLQDAEERALKAIGKGLLKTISKMGISTLPSYCGAQIFEAVGLSTGARRQALHRHAVAHRRHRHARARRGRARPACARVSRRRRELLPVVGLYAWRRDGEHHQWNPETIALLQHAVRGGGHATYEEFAATVNDDSARRSTLRGLLRFRDAGADPARGGRAGLGDREAVLDRRHVARLALARGARDARSRDEPDRRPFEHRRRRRGPGAYFDDERRSKIKQVASGRFGVNIDYLTNADELQIKMAQGAKPGEGGQLPGHKVDAVHRRRPFHARRAWG